MTLTTHAAIGAAIGHQMGNPLLGFCLGMISHFLVDMIPHGDGKFAESFLKKQRKTKAAVAYVTVDAAIAILFILVLMNLGDYTNRLAFSASIAGSIMPDLLTALADVTKARILKPFVKLHFFFHNFFLNRYGDVKLSYAIVGQAGFIALLLQRILA